MKKQILLTNYYTMTILLFMIMLFAFRMNAEADEEHFSNGSYR